MSALHLLVIQAVSVICSSAAPCHNFDFENFDVTVPAPYTAEYICQNAVNVTGIDCTSGS